MSSAPATSANLTGIRVAHSHDSVVPPYLLANGLGVQLKVIIILPFVALRTLQSAFYLLHSLLAVTFLL